jgi:DNA-binding CsgD family transcriptional regulator
MDSDSFASKSFSSEMPENFLQAVLSSFGDHLDIIDHEFRILWTSFPPPDLDSRGRPCYEIYHGRTEPCRACPVKMVFQSGVAAVTEKQVKLPHVHRLWGEVRTYPVRDERGRVTHALKICLDVSDKKTTDTRQQSYLHNLETTLRGVDRREAPAPTTIPPGDLTDPLSGREVQVLRLMTQGFTNKEIARILAISPHTIKTHVTHIFDKLGVNDRSQAAVQAFRLRLI